METPPPILPREIQFEWTREVLRMQARRSFTRQFRRPLIAFSIFAVIATASLIFGSPTDSSATPWTLLIISLVVHGMSVLIYLSTMKTFVELTDLRIKVRVEYESITFETCESISTLKWSAFDRVVRYPDTLLLFRGPTGGRRPSALPVAALG